jgi:hypothetical protein
MKYQGEFGGESEVMVLTKLLLVPEPKSHLLTVAAD